MKTLLLVDDESDLVVALEMLFGMEGYRVMTAHDGRDALAKLQDETPDLIITDRMMPRMDGIELCKQLRQEPTTAMIPIVLISASRSVRWDSAGLYDVSLQKPARLEALLDVIHGLIGSDAAAG